MESSEHNPIDTLHVDPADIPQGVECIGSGAGDRDKLFDMLEGIQLLSHSSRKDIDVISNYVQAYRAPTGTAIMKEGGKERILWLLSSGVLEVYKECDDEGQKMLATIRAGKSVGEMSLIDEQPHSATVVAAKECTLLLLTKQNFFRMAAEHPRQGMNLTWRLAQMLSHRLRQTSGKLIEYL